LLPVQRDVGVHPRDQIFGILVDDGAATQIGRRRYLIYGGPSLLSCGK